MLFGHFGGNFGYFYSYHLVTLFNSQIGSNTNSSNGKKGLRHEWQLPQQPKANLNSAFWTSSSTSTTFIPSRKVFCVFCVCVQLVIEYIPILTSTHKTPFKIFFTFFVCLFVGCLPILPIPIPILNGVPIAQKYNYCFLPNVQLELLLFGV